MLKQIIKRVLRSTSYQISARKPGFAELMQHHNITSVLDVGANEGQYGLELREHGFSGKIVSFEPIAAVYEQLEIHARKDPQWTTVHAGVGALDERRSINVSDATVFSSFLGLSDYSAGKFETARSTRAEVVDVTRLDSYLLQHPLQTGPAYLKIDTQGFEREVLAGAGQRLKDFKLVQAELALCQLYKDQDDWLSLIHWMDSQGFRVIAAKENGFDYDRVELLELDIVFLNTR